MDFVKILERSKRNELEIYPDFQTGDVTDILGRGKEFQAIWDEESGLWSTKENDVQKLVDKELWAYADKVKNARNYEGRITVLTLKSDSSGSWNRFTQYMRRFPNSGVQLDCNLTFLNSKVKKTDYASKRLPYSLEDGDYSAWDEIVERLYAPKEREKIEWAIGAIVAGDSKKIQKFFVFYGDPGTGKGTIIDIIKKLFVGYYVNFDAKALGSSSDQFSMEIFRSNPIVAIQADGDLSRIEDNTRINSIVSHEEMLVNEKGKPRYSARMNCFLFIGTNKPVKITDAKSGIIRRLIDISPKNKTNAPIPPKEYDALMSRIDFQLGAIAKHCLDVYRDLGRNYYKNYTPQGMIEKTDVFYNFVEASMDVFMEQDGVTLKQAYAMYKEYCADALVEFKLPMYKFREELKNYFKVFEERASVDGKQMRKWYSGFKIEKMEPPVLKKEQHSLPLTLEDTVSVLDGILKDCPAQYATDEEKPGMPWGEVETTLKDIDTHRLHYVRVPKEHIVIDFDLRNENGEKDILRNLEAASKWPRTYAEFSKGGAGIHLHYIYEGDVDKLACVYADGIEIKVFRGRASLRRRLSKCMNADIATLAEGSLPFREEKMIDTTLLKDELHLRNVIKKCLRKANHGATRPEIDLIAKALDDAYRSGMDYDVSDMKHDILVFAMNSTNQSDYCVKAIKKMKFVGKDREFANTAFDALDKIDKKNKEAYENAPIVFYDVEVFPNLFLVNWKLAGSENKVNRMINPRPSDIEPLFRYRLIGFNCRKYDNHILYGRYLGLSNEMLYDLSQRIIVQQARDAFYQEAYDISYTDVYDFASKKQSLKKWEIELGIHHQELGLPWDQPVPEAMWEKVAEYCDNDVIATEAVFNACKGDFTAREILADIAEGKVNDTTNQLTTKIIFGNDRKPKLEYTDLSELFPGYSYTFDESDKKYHNMYRGADLGRGGYVYAEPGIYSNVALIDVQSMHPSSAVNLNYFGDYTQHFKDILDTRVAIKKGDFSQAQTMFDGKLQKYLGDKSSAKQLAQALKIAINSVYGLTSASFDNPFRDKRNVNNIVALRGALFMKTLQDEVVARGYKVAHIKTDSIKIPNATMDIIQFCLDFAKKYGYVFEHEATYERMCLVNDAVYIARYETSDACKESYGYIPGDNADHGGEWTATGAQFQHPYIFKTLFSGEPVEFRDMCETKSVSGGAIYLDINENMPNVEAQEEELARRIFNDSNPEKKKKLNPDYVGMSNEELINDISKGHDYRFIGRCGLFYPVRPGCGGGIMYRLKDEKYYSVTGTKGFRWLEADMVQLLKKESDLDRRYFDELEKEAISAINEFGDFDSFIDTELPYVPPVRHCKSSDDPPWDEPVVPCGDGKYNSCMECPDCKGDICRRGYSLSSYIVKGGGGT